MFNFALAMQGIFMKLMKEGVDCANSECVLPPAAGVSRKKNAAESRGMSFKEALQNSRVVW